MRKIFSALDIGTNSIKLVVAEVIFNKLNVLCAEKVPSRGIKGNYIYDKDLLKESIKNVIDKVEEKLNIRIRRVILNLPSSDLNFVLTDGKIDIDTDNVGSNDIVRLLQDVSKNKLSNDEELICTLPIVFKVDNEEVYKPFGKKGNKLAVKSILVSTDKRSVYEIAGVVNSLGIDIIDLTTTGLVDYYNFKNKDLDNKNIIVVNLGYTNVSISVFSKGIFVNNRVIEEGGFYIDKKLAEEFKLRRNETEYLKYRLGLASLTNADKNESVKLVNKEEVEIEINQEDVSKIVSNSMNNLLKIIKKEINLLTKKEISYIIITGGLSEMKDINLLINNEINKTGRIGQINDLGARDNCYSVALGMLKYFNEKLILRNRDFTSLSEEEIYQMCLVDSGDNGTNSFISLVASYFFDN